MNKFGFKSILMRWLLVVACLLATYNPSGRSYFHWIQDSHVSPTIKLSVGLLLIAFNYILIRLTFRSLGYVGVAMLTACVGSFAYTLVRTDIVTIATLAGFQIYLLISMSVGLAIGVCWSAIRARFSGQIDSDDISRRL